jgi:ABC-2 type transport system permease protein
VFSLAKVTLSWALISVLAWGLFSFGVFGIGPVLGVYGAILLVFGIALALLVLGLVFLLGREADELAWATAAVILPFSAVFYPVASLPGWARGVAEWVPAAHVFESLRVNLAGGMSTWGGLGTAALLDLGYLVVGFAFARAMLVRFRRRGYVTRYM